MNSREILKGIILAGGKGTRLGDMTKAVSKQLLPVYNKPMIYYPLSVMLRAGVKEIAIITNPHNIEAYRSLLGAGEEYGKGVSFTYIPQENPIGLAHAYILAEDFLDCKCSVMMLGDNIFLGNDIDNFCSVARKMLNGSTTCMLAGYEVSDPSQYGVARYFYEPIPASSRIHVLKEVVEKPPKDAKISNVAIPGVYFMDATAPDRAKRVKPSERGELEITSLINDYIGDNSIGSYTPLIHILSNDTWWFDCGTPQQLLEAANLISAAERRSGRQIGSPFFRE